MAKKLKTVLYPQISKILIHSSNITSVLHLEGEILKYPITSSGFIFTIMCCFEKYFLQIKQINREC